MGLRGRVRWHRRHRRLPLLPRPPDHEHVRGPALVPAGAHLRGAGRAIPPARGCRCATPVAELTRLGYREVDFANAPGSWSARGNTLRAVLRPFRSRRRRAWRTSPCHRVRRRPRGAHRRWHRRRAAHRPVGTAAGRQLLPQPRRRPADPLAGGNAAATASDVEGGGGPHLRLPPRFRPQGHRARCLGEPLHGRTEPRREHPHAAARALLLPHQRAQLCPQAQGAGLRGVARGTLHESGPDELVRQRNPLGVRTVPAPYTDSASAASSTSTSPSPNSAHTKLRCWWQ